MKKVLAFLSGKKTHLVAVVLAVTQLLVEQGVISLSTKQLIVVNSLLIALGFSALRSAVAKTSLPPVQ